MSLALTMHENETAANNTISSAPKNLIVELDGNLHTEERDLFKNNLVLGKYRLLRINTIKTNKKHIEACFKNQLLPLLNQ